MFVKTFFKLKIMATLILIHNEYNIYKTLRLLGLIKTETLMLKNMYSSLAGL